MPTELEIKRYMGVLRRFVEVYCRKNHAARRSGDRCEQCTGLLEYARKKLERCPHDPKPMCKDCDTQCYRPPHKGLMKDVMKCAVKHYAMRGRLDVLLRGLKSG